MSQHRAGALGEAERRYRHILTVFPAHADSLHNLGLIALHGGNAAAAADLIGQAIAIDDSIAEYHYNIASALRVLKRMDDVAAHLERAIELRSDHALAHLNLGNVRREQGRLADAAACYERAVTLSPNLAGARFNLANMLFEQGRWDEAIASYHQGLAREPAHAEAHRRLGAALLAQGKIGEAVPHFERAVALKPDLAGAYDDLAKAYAAVEKLDLATFAASRALELNETPQAKALFAQCAKFTRFTADDTGRFRRLLLRALNESWSRPRELANVCISLIKLNGVVRDRIARANAAWPARLPAAELFGASEPVALADDELLISLLECDPVTDVGLERLLTNVRHAMLTIATGDGQAVDEQHLKFFAAVARQCFINDYVYALPETETRRARALRSALAQGIEDGAPVPAMWPISVGAYFPLHTLPNADALLTRSWPGYVDGLLVQQIKEPAQERRIATTIPVLTGIESEVSRAVRRQYEENPYPRWVTSGPPAQPISLHDRPSGALADVLIAGCGTGLSTNEFARQTINARILAIDLSLASLSYAKRMAENLGLTNVEFGQADLMMLAAIDRQFDFIDASGVLHHLADPWAGWRVLLSLLRPGGVMQVGLYSELARANIVAVRALIAARGYRPIVEDIRRCREDIMAADDGTVLKSVSQIADFFTTSECRDLLFHVQEHRITLPQIRSFLAANNVQFAGFILEPPIWRQFAMRFPDQGAMLDLDCWHALETEAPGLFTGMYQFWVSKPGAALSR